MIELAYCCLLRPSSLVGAVRYRLEVKGKKAMSEMGQANKKLHGKGIEVHLEATESPEALVEALRHLSGGTAFSFAGLSHDADESLPKAHGGRWAQFYRARFALRADQGVVGDPQIFALLRGLAARYRWSRVEKVHLRTVALPRLVRAATG